MKAISVIDNPEFGQKGFTLTFENGYTISVQLGKHNYSNGKWNAEVAAWNTNGGDFVQILPNEGDVIGWCEPNQILQLMNKVANLPISINE
jgi:hypothetical protein